MELATAFITVIILIAIMLFLHQPQFEASYRKDQEAKRR